MRAARRGTRQARAQDRIHLHTNEAEIGEVLRDGGVSIEDPLAVFGVVLKNLPERVQVYPTENYLYFRFTQKGTVYVGQHPPRRRRPRPAAK